MISSPQLRRSPAKLNLLLLITGRRPDGYHELQTVFQFISLYDELTFSATADGEIYLDDAAGTIPITQNLVYRAAKLLQQTCGLSSAGAKIQLRKTIPMGAGLGGGSSNAATTLLTLNGLWDTNLDTPELCKLGAQLGADVPIFIHGQSSWAEGVGDKFEPISLPEPWYLVVNPGVHVSTAEIFGDSALTRDADRITIRDFLAGEHGNSCEYVVRSRFPQVAQAMNWLDQFAEARLTGTGACIFAEFPSEEAATQAAQQLPGTWKGHVCKGINRSPALSATT